MRSHTHVSIEIAAVYSLSISNSEMLKKRWTLAPEVLPASPLQRDCFSWLGQFAFEVQKFNKHFMETTFIPLCDLSNTAIISERVLID